MSVNLRLTRLLSSLPKTHGHFLGCGSTKNGDTLSIFGDLDTRELVEINLDTLLHLSQSGDCSMSTVLCQEGQVLLVGKFDLSQGVSLSEVQSLWVTETRGVVCIRSTKCFQRPRGK